MKERLTLSEVQRIVKKSHSTVSKILYGAAAKYGFNDATIKKVTFYARIDQYLETAFKRLEFKTICETVISKTTRRDDKEFARIIHLSSMCKKYHDYFNDGDDFTGLTKTPLEIFIDSIFVKICTVATEKCKDENVRMFASELANLSIEIRESIK